MPARTTSTRSTSTARIPGSTNNQNGFFIFTDARGGSSAAPAPTSKAAVANVALGLFDTYARDRQRSYTLFRGNMFEGFAAGPVACELQAGAGVWAPLQRQHAVLRHVGQPVLLQSEVLQPVRWLHSESEHTASLTGGDPLNGVVIPGSGFPSAAKGHVPDAILANGYASLFHGYQPRLSSHRVDRHPAALRLRLPDHTWHGDSCRRRSLHSASRHQRQRAGRRQCAVPAAHRL